MIELPGVKWQAVHGRHTGSVKQNISTSQFMEGILDMLNKILSISQFMEGILDLSHKILSTLIIHLCFDCFNLSLL